MRHANGRVLAKRLICLALAAAAIFSCGAGSDASRDTVAKWHCPCAFRRLCATPSDAYSIWKMIAMQALSCLTSAVMRGDFTDVQSWKQEYLPIAVAGV